MRGEGAEQNDQRFEHCTLAAPKGGKFVYRDHEGADGCIEREVLDILLFFADELV